MLTVAEVQALSSAELAGLLGRGHAVDPAALAGWVYRGTSLGLPRFVERLTWKTFQKAFHLDPVLGCVRGWNVRIDQASGRPRRRRGVPVTFGHFAVVAAPEGGGLLLDYGVAGGRFSVLARLRDPLVAVRPGDPSLLLGRSLLDLGAARLPTPSFFTLEREAPLDEVAPAPPTFACAPGAARSR